MSKSFMIRSSVSFSHMFVLDGRLVLRFITNGRRQIHLTISLPSLERNFDKHDVIWSLYQAASHCFLSPTLILYKRVWTLLSCIVVVVRTRLLPPPPKTQNSLLNEHLPSLASKLLLWCLTNQVREWRMVASVSTLCVKNSFPFRCPVHLLSLKCTCVMKMPAFKRPVWWIRFLQLWASERMDFRRLIPLEVPDALPMIVLMRRFEISLNRVKATYPNC